MTLTDRRMVVAIGLIDKVFGGPFRLEQKQDYITNYNLTEDEWLLLCELKGLDANSPT